MLIGSKYIPDFYRLTWKDKYHVIFARGTKREYIASVEHITLREVTKICGKVVMFCDICWPVSEYCLCNPDNIVQIDGEFYRVLKRESSNKFWR